MDKQPLLVADWKKDEDEDADTPAEIPPPNVLSSVPIVVVYVSLSVAIAIVVAVSNGYAYGYAYRTYSARPNFHTPSAVAVPTRLGPRPTSRTDVLLSNDVVSIAALRRDALLVVLEPRHSFVAVCND